MLKRDLYFFLLGAGNGAVMVLAWPNWWIIPIALAATAAFVYNNLWVK